MIAATDSPPLTRPRSKWRERLVLLLILASGSALSLLAGNNVHTTEALRLKEQITAANNAVVSAFKLEVTRTTEAIRSAGLMLEASPQLSREQFNRYMQKMLADQLSVNLMEWQPIVPANQLPAFEAAARTAGLTNFRVLEPEGKGWKLVSGRNEYVPVLFAWPETYRTAGLDMSFSSERMASKLQSRAIAQPVASGTFAFMKDGMVNSGVTAIAISTAVFAIDNATKNFLTAEAARPVSLNNAYLGHTARGYLAAVVDLPTLFLQATHVADAAKFDLLVFASTAADAAPIYTWLGDDSDLQQMTSGLRQATTADQSTIVDFAHQSWTLVLHPRPAFYAALANNAALWVVATGMAMTLLLLALAAIYLRANARLISEISSRSVADQALQHQQVMMERSEHMAHLASFEWAVDSNIVTWSPEMFRIFGRDPALGIPNLEGQVELYTPESTQTLLAAVQNAVANGTPYELELMAVQPDGEQRPCFIKGFPQRDSSGRVVRIAGLVQDITERKRAEVEINSLAFFDPLTNLPNRRLLMDRLRHALSLTTRHEQHGALLFIDLDNFKNVNDSLGHAIGDQLLQQVAQRLLSCLRERDTVGRLGGDEFVVVLESLSSVAKEAATEAEHVGKLILELLNLPYELDTYLQHISPSIGVTLFADYHGPVEDLLKQADLAMYRAKASGRNTLRFFDQQMQTVVTQHAALERELRQAIMHEDFVVFFQAQVDEMANLTGAEALLRWQHPQRGIISPAAFIPLAEETGLILPLGNWVLKTACEQLAAWAISPNFSHLTLAVNVSPRQFMSPTFAQEACAILDQTGANPQRLKLELTESLLVADVDDIISKMTVLKARGVEFSLDDFGTGYSSLSYLKRLPLNQLKIDQHFVSNILSDANDAAIAKMIVALAETMGLAVIAEGVETTAQKEFLDQLGCRAYQGYLFSQPLPIGSFEQFASNARSAAQQQRI